MSNKTGALQKLQKGKLKDFVDAGKSNTRVIGKVERHVLSKPVDNSRSFDGLHPSAIVSKFWCHRASYFHLKGNHPVPSPRKFSSELIFAQGHAIHDTWQTWFWEMGTLYGAWQCKACKHYWMALSPSNCPSCDSTALKYREVPIQLDELMITGHSDGWLKGFGDDLMLEIKSVGAGTFMWLDKGAWFANEQNFDTAWKNLTSPFESHIAQIQLYMEVLNLAGVTDVPNEAVVLYEAKPTQAVKEFIVRRDTWAIQHIIDGAKLVVESLGKNIAPDCNVGGAHKCKQCEGFNE
jgi:hypothetical protein